MKLSKKMLKELEDDSWLSLFTKQDDSYILIYILLIPYVFLRTSFKKSISRLIYLFIVLLSILSIIFVLYLITLIPTPEKPEKIIVIGEVSDAIYKCRTTCGFSSCKEICETKNIRINNQWYNLIWYQAIPLNVKIRLSCEENLCYQE